jgi:hypothetical protein
MPKPGISGADSDDEPDKTGIEFGGVFERSGDNEEIPPI